MARTNQRRSQNVAGNFYVDHTCIDCDTCRWMAPEVFTRIDKQSAVYNQPLNDTENLKAYQALLSCPTSSIGTVDKPDDIKSVHQSFPILIEDNVYDCGYHSELSFAATSYLIVRPQGNILVDSPRFSPPLVKRLEEMGGIKYMYLTHRDDIADHQKFQAHFQCDRILHLDDITDQTADVEIKLSGTNHINFAPDILIIPVPGHTLGHTVLLYKNKFLFTGDHLAGNTEFNRLIAFHDFCWYDWHEQIKSMKTLLDYRFEWVLPGHGRRYHNNLELMQAELRKCFDWMFVAHQD